MYWKAESRSWLAFRSRAWPWRARTYVLCACAILTFWLTPIVLNIGSNHSSPPTTRPYPPPSIPNPEFLNDGYGLPNKGTTTDLSGPPPPEEPVGESEPIEVLPTPPLDSIPLEDPNSLPEDGITQDSSARGEDEAPSGDSDQHTISWSDAEASYNFPPDSERLSLDAKADTLPDLIHIPFEDAVIDEELVGWEDDWFAHANFDADRWGSLEEPKIDFIYTWVNGSEDAFAKTMRPYEEASSLNDPEGEWMQSHGSNRYRSWDELRYSIRSVEKFAGDFRNKIQLLVNAVDKTSDPEFGRFSKQRPLWLKDDDDTKLVVETLSQEDFFNEEEHGALPSFNSLTIESQLYNTPSNIDRFFAMSDDMLLGRHHSASDIYSPLFGPTLGFKSNGYNTQTPPGEVDARRFGEKPYLIYTSWMLNRRFGVRKRKGQVHFGHSMSRSIAREVRDAFPRPSLKSACQRFRGESGFQLYTWYAAFHYTIERHREALLYSYIVLRSDTNGDGNLGWSERQAVMAELEAGMANEGDGTHRKRIFYRVAKYHREAGLEPPKVNIDTQWTSLDGPITIRDIECYEFDVNECLAPGFSSPASDVNHRSVVFDTAAMYDRVARQDPRCGDCLLKLILNQKRSGLDPLLPPATMSNERALVIKALKRYQYSIVEPDALFMMITDTEQVEHMLLNRFLRGTEGGKREVGQLCLNDDVVTTDPKELAGLQNAMLELFEGLLPEPSRFEK
ncbi:hypothetical protein NW752_003228 [Fusarium irregulare]|uniref:Uncharacterized protein n=1 Tax=Fusarium irregulare TaxID=2494466 RepID=A0A9W8Q168_9HYPO|nr:hypothetical protein NW766_000913 [Fusarium irregulare]KAJ4025752.1 hypothetical protein NW752_003228 [Fusarium irregulare]